MPGFDKKGPAGQGPGTGRGMGDCQTTVDSPDTGKGIFRGNRPGMGRGMNAMMGRGEANRFGNGRRRGNRCVNRGIDQRFGENIDDLSWIKSQIRSLGDLLESIEQRLPGKNN